MRDVSADHGHDLSSPQIPWPWDIGVNTLRRRRYSRGAIRTACPIRSTVMGVRYRGRLCASAPCGYPGAGAGCFTGHYAAQAARDGQRLHARANSRCLRSCRLVSQRPSTDAPYIGEYREFSRVSGLTIDKNDTIYAADSESDARRHPGWRKGIRIGSLKDGKVTIFIPGHETDSPDGAMGEGIALDATSNLYTAEATVRGVTKYVKNQVR